jgi:glycosyltransferase involved in cell wall biosynthesis
MLKILVIAPFPPTIIRKRDFYLVNNLRGQDLRIEWVCIVEDRENIEQMVQENDHFKMKIFNVKKAVSLINTLLGILPFSKYPLQSHFTLSRAMGRYLRRVTSQNEYDVIHYVHIRSTIYERFIDPKFRGRSLIDLPDCSTYSYFNIFKNISIRQFAKKLVYAIEKNRIAKYESRLPILDLVLISATEVERFSKWVPSYRQYRLHVIENGIEKLNANDDKRANVENRQIIFLGKMSYISNQLLVKEFYTNVFSRLNDEENFKFIIAGSDPPDSIKKLQQEKKGITVTGFVAETSGYLRSSDIFIATFKTGSGVQNKVLEAMRYGCIVLCTQIVAEPLALEHNYNAIISESDQATLSYIRDIATHPSKYQHVRENALKYVNNYTSWETSAEKFVQLYKEIAK